MESSFHLFFILIFLSFSNCQVYEFGSISWTTQNTTTSVNFHVKLAFSGTNSIGSTYSSSNTFHFGDGNFISLPSLKVISQLSNVFITETYFSYTYSSNSNNGSYWIAYLRGCCRSQSLLNNANSTFFLQTQLNLNNAVGNASPVSEASPIIRTVKGPNSISIYAIDPNGDSLTFGLAAPNQFSDGSGSQPIGLSIDPQIGVISWDTSSITNGLYSAVIFVSDSQSNIASIEFMLLVNNNPGSCASSCLNSGFTCLVGSLTCLLCGNAPNPCVPSSPPYFLSQTLPLSNFLFLAPGIPFVQTIQAADLDLLQTVSLSNLGMPEGATFVTLGLNPVIGTMSWTPTQSQVGMNNVCFQALNSLGLAAPLLCLTLEVGMNFPVNLLINGNAETNSLIGWTINSGTFITVPSNIGSYSFCDPSGTAVRTQVIDLLTYGLLPIQVLDQGLGINFQQGYYPQSIPDAEIFTLNVSVIDSSDQILASKVMTYVPSNTQPFIFSYSFTQIAGTPKLIIWQDTVQNGNCKTYLDNASVTLSLILNPFGNLCSITPGIGTAFQTNFTIQCQNSLNTGLSLLSFQFFYTYNGETISLGAPSTSSSRNLVLPEGNITAYVEIGTILGSFISVTTNPVTVLSFGAPPSLSQVITEVAIWEVTQKYEDVLNTIFVGTTILQGNPIALNQIIRETLMNQTQLSISKIIENKDSITQQSRVIEAIIANASEVDLYVRYSSINLLQNLTKISLIVSLEPQAFQVIFFLFFFDSNSSLKRILEKDYRIGLK